MSLGDATHAELQRIASCVLAGERRVNTLRPTELVHEAWLRLRGSHPPSDRRELAIHAARAMREILIDRARARSAAKRGGAIAPARLGDRDFARERDAYLCALDESLCNLAEHDVELATIVELRFFGGLSIEEVAALLRVSPRTVKRRWQLAKGWLHRDLAGA